MAKSKTSKKIIEGETGLVVKKVLPKKNKVEVKLKPQEMVTPIRAVPIVEELLKAEHKIVFTQSRLMDFLTCERLEWFKFQAGGNGIESISRPDFFLEGEFGHYALSHWYANPPHGLMLRENMIKRINKMIDGLGEVEPEEMDRKRSKLSAVIGACHAYKLHYKTDFEKYNIILNEEKFEIELGGVTFKGRMDLGIEDKKTKEIGFVEHKFLSSFSLNTYTSLPLNLQQLIYTLGFKELTGKYPNWYIWNVIKKSSLRRKGMKPKKGEMVAHPEALLQYEARVQQQYIEKPEDMFFRTPPRLVEAKAIENLREMVAGYVLAWKDLQATGKIPPMRFSSCEMRYGQPCSFAPACKAWMAGSKQGWDAGECAGLYKKKLVRHPELEDKKEVKSE